MTQPSSIWESLSGSRMLAGMAILMTNIGAKYLVLDLDKSHELMLQDPWVRRVVLFCVLFLATRDILSAFLLTVVMTALLEWSRHSAAARTSL